MWPKTREIGNDMHVKISLYPCKITAAENKPEREKRMKETDFSN